MVFCSSLQVAFEMCTSGTFIHRSFFFFWYIFGHFSMVNWMLRVCRMLGGNNRNKWERDIGWNWEMIAG